MSSSSIHLKTINGPARLHLSDHQMNSIATGYGELERADLAAGLYLLEIDAGSHHEERIIAVKPGERYKNLDLEVQFPSAVPMGGTSTSHEYHAYPAAELSRHPNLPLGTGGRLMIFVRHVGEGDHPAIDFAALSLLDQHLQPLVSGGSLATSNVGVATDGWAGLCADLDPGGYALESPLPGEPGQSLASLLQEERVQQSLWVAQGWTTLVFLPCLAGQSLPSLDLASIHMTRVHAGFQPYDDDSLQVNLAAEMATHGFRTGQHMVPADLLNLLIHTKFQNPMLGILGAHVLLQSPQPNWSLFDTVVKNLKKMLGDAPDCSALEVLGRERRRTKGDGPLETVSWPPMLAAGYRGLIAGDADEPGLVKPDSVADHAAVGLHTSWPWSRWSRLAPSRLEQAVAASTRSTSLRGDSHKALSKDDAESSLGDLEGLFGTFAAGSRGFGGDLEVKGGSFEAPLASSPQNKALDVVEEWLQATDVEATPLQRSYGDSPEVVQVADYLQRMAEQSTYGRADLSKMDLPQLSRRVGLPVSSVRRAIGALKK